MKEIYDWVDWFRKLAKKIEAGGEAYLIEKANAVEWGSNHSLLNYGDENIDPFSFFYFLAQKNTSNQREPVYESVNEVFAIADNPPETGYGSTYIIPTPSPNAAALFHDGQNFNSDLLWKLFRQAVKDKPDVQAEDFHAALNIPYVGVIKLTQCLFLINPRCFISIDNSFPNFTSIKGQVEKQKGWNVCLEAIDGTKPNFPRCHLYEIARVYYLLQRKYITLRRNFYQISTNCYDDGNDYWNDFKTNNWVYSGGPASGQPWGNAEVGTGYPLTKPKQGDIILVRTGRTRGRAIGIVDHNDYAEPNGLNEKSRIHVLWINKSETQLPSDTDMRAFTKTEPDSGTCNAFRNTDSYEPTFEFIESWTENSVEDGSGSYLVGQEQVSEIVDQHYPLNQILYGPPGTGKTWNTVNRALAIIDDESVDDLENKDREEIKKRFDELKEDRQIEMVTFHQNYSYEDFIEGIRPVLAKQQKTGDKEQGDKTDIKYRLSSGIFKRIALRAKKDREQNYVLIIDEINRGNIAKIFGELITLVEESKRLGNDDGATTVLPYSKKSFGIPDNLYIIGTMNTADRSIALLDTALRRRFEFIEMMPVPDHSGVSEDSDGVNCQKLLEAMNKRIRVLHDRDHQIGHTYFMDVNDINSLAKTFKNQIIPLLQEYFYDDWEKIDLVLNKNGFIQESGVDKSLFQSSDLVDAERKIYELLPAKDNKWQDPGSYIKIYQTETQSTLEGQES